MSLIDLRSYLIEGPNASHGIWLTDDLLRSQTPAMTLADTKQAGRLMLRWNGDTVVLTGKLRVRVSFQSENLTYSNTVASYLSDPTWINGGEVPGDSISMSLLPGLGTLQANTIYSYVIDIPAGQIWPFSLNEQAVFHRMGNNFGFRVIIEPAFEAAATVQPLGDLPCDFAAVNQPNVGQFFPAACEPCPPGTAVGLPPGGPALGIPVADGGCIRPRYFNGMFITKEDLETEQRYFRLKSRLHNRADGQGVVWGLNVGKAGNQICVLPGYALDCCGNDLALTSVYKVDIATLLRDPAAMAALSAPQSFATFPPNVPPPPATEIGPFTYARPISSMADVRYAGTFASATTGIANPAAGVRMHLLLEYVECPTDPRPVHADPCAGTASRCEMSRIRETVRLRLVPPRDVSTAGPIQNFLNTVRGLRGTLPDYTDSLPAPELTAPWKLEFEFTCNQPDNCANNTEFDPNESTSTLNFTPAGFPDRFFTEFAIGMRTSGPALFVDGTVTVAPPVTIENGPSLRPNGLEFDLPRVVIPITSTTMVTYTFTMADWRTQSLFAPANGPTLGGNFTLTVQVSQGEIIVTRAAGSTLQEFETDLSDPFCTGEPCLPAGAPPILPNFPWLHADAVDKHCNGTPLDKLGAGDPKVLILAALGGWLTKLTAQHGDGTTGEEWSTRRILSTALYEGVWRLFYGVEQGPGRANVQEAVRKLFKDWCEALLYKGPQCAGEPHGVVIGCTIVSAGGIGDIDPYGGRRWVMKYPLLAHWTQQMGMVPFDVMASRMLSSLCCVASLPSIGELDALPALVLELGGCLLTFGPIAEVNTQVRDDWGLDVTAGTELSFIEFVAKFIEALGMDSIQEPEPDPDTGEITILPATRFTLGPPAQPCALSIICASEEIARIVVPPDLG